MKKRKLIYPAFILIICFHLTGFSQSNRPKTKTDTVFMTYYGKDLPNSNYNANTKVEEGILVKGKKEAMWTKYYPDGKTPKLKGKYVSNAPNGPYEKYGKQLGVTKHFYNNGTLALSYESKEDKVRGDVTWYEKSGVISSQIHIKKQGKIEAIVHNDLAFNSNIPILTKGFNSIRVAGPILKDGPFDPNGYNVVYNKQDELYQVGNFKFGSIYTGKIYNYDTNGLLKSISIYRDGFFFSEGKIN